MKNILFALILLLAGFAIYGTSGLVMDEWAIGNICPKILGIPACYLVLFCFLVALIGHLIPAKTGTWIFFLFVGVVMVIATIGTFGELTGLTKCPRTAGGTPMCFISLAICVSLLVSKILWLKRSKIL